jgi:hypothetical protein
VTTEIDRTGFRANFRHLFTDLDMVKAVKEERYQSGIDAANPSHRVFGPHSCNVENTMRDLVLPTMSSTTEPSQLCMHHRMSHLKAISDTWLLTKLTKTTYKYSRNDI